jgi:putative glutamine amidotransferase
MPKPYEKQQPMLAKLATVFEFNEHFGESALVTDLEDLKSARGVILWGGEDISPSFYGEVCIHAEADNKPSSRDIHEWSVCLEAIRLGIPIIGVCRGAQLLCCVDGGSLWQHVGNHNGNHDLLYEQTTGTTNSFHHQMMRPGKDAKVLATCVQRSPLKYADSASPVRTNSPEPEIVYFKDINAIGVQGHPEWLEKSSFLNLVVKDISKKYLNLEVL